MAAWNNVKHAFSRNTFKRVFNVKLNGNLVKKQCTLTHVLDDVRPSVSVVNISPKTRQLLNTINKSNKWNKSVLENITQRSSSVICLLGNGNATLLTSLCTALDELSTEGDDDSTNRKKRIYFPEQLNDDP
ncbi:uncharacterized protein LOC114517423 [Dendronephthya gigantea]|uniref:uncharacterized protein LOC114517423 n=1 Tax=Dendronephthya gigantea TaxID=151771 RepID=UPI001068E1E9|nr:uncharacterized protein LOC114517423 [Dendronephthya gigantea]